ncbi:hypothetical protein [Spirosoma jeollabukense]
MVLKHITSVVLTAGSCLYFTACHKEESGITPSKPFHITINDQRHFNVKPLVLIDGIAIDDPTKVKINPADIASMTVLKSDSTNNLVDTYGPKAKAGVILVSTRRNK